MYPELVKIVRLGYTNESLYGDEGEWTKGGHIVIPNDCFWRHARLYIPIDLVLKYKFLFELHDNGYACHRGYAIKLAKAPNTF
jgi:hypothetical protein